MHKAKGLRFATEREKYAIYLLRAEWNEQREIERISTSDHVMFLKLIIIISSKKVRHEYHLFLNLVCAKP